MSLQYDLLSNLGYGMFPIAEFLRFDLLLFLGFFPPLYHPRNDTQMF